MGRGLSIIGDKMNWQQFCEKFEITDQQLKTQHRIMWDKDGNLRQSFEFFKPMKPKDRKRGAEDIGALLKAALGDGATSFGKVKIKRKKNEQIKK